MFGGQTATIWNNAADAAAGEGPAIEFGLGGTGEFGEMAMGLAFIGRGEDLFDYGFVNVGLDEDDVWLEMYGADGDVAGSVEVYVQDIAVDMFLTAPDSGSPSGAAWTILLIMPSSGLARLSAIAVFR